MATIIVGGNFGETPKASSVVNQIVKSIPYPVDVVNGGTFEDIESVDLSGYKLILWMPNIDNGYDKVYPKKDTGAILICSKVLRENRTEVDAITRIFQIHGNAVIAINSDTKPFTFNLIDALGNSWIKTTDIGELTKTIEDFVTWTSDSIRSRTRQLPAIDFDFTQYQEFVDINREVADKFEIINSRFFGNCSTRCSKMFPTYKVDATHMVVSKRNVSKKRLTTEDLVLTRIGEDGSIEYFGESKPSVDTPIQISLYRDFPNINYMIHGHTYVEGGIFTDNYFPCGDMREYHETKGLIKKDYGVLNLTNHGFFMFADTLENLRTMVDNMIFIERNVGFETIKKLNNAN